MARHRYCRRNINAAIGELREAQRFLAKRKFERAEDELADAITDIARALRCINRRERYR